MKKQKELRVHRVNQGAGENRKLRKHVSHLLSKCCDGSWDDMKASVGVSVINKKNRPVQLEINNAVSSYALPVMCMTARGSEMADEHFDTR